MLTRILLVLESGKLRSRMRMLLAGMDVHINLSNIRTNFWNRLAHENYDLIVVSRTLIPDSASHTIAQLRALPDRPDILVLSNGEEPEERARLLAAGCLAILNEQLPDDVLRDTLAALIARRSEWQSTQAIGLRGERQARLSDFVSASSSMQAFMEIAHRVVATDSTLLILGETGVGKERLARAIHNEGPRSSGPFIAVNCGALPEALLESELFGHEEGAFTGATRARRGFFELAHRGTIFLDEVGEIPQHLQVKLLRVLQDYEIQRVGSENRVPVDVRVVAATNRNLEDEIESKRFRRDFYYRLAVVTLTVPPLRERREDIRDLVDSYIAHFNARLRREIEGISDDALQGLLAYSWPGNVRELINVMERAVLLCGSSRITPMDLPPSVTAARQMPVPSEAGSIADQSRMPLPTDVMQKPWQEARQAVLACFERAYFSQLLHSTRGRIGDTAQQAGIQPRSLFQKMKTHGLRKEEFRG